MELCKMMFLALATVTCAVSGKSVKGASKIASIVQEFPSTTREPSIQAYGLPKRVLISNGEIERVHLDSRFAIDDSESNEKPLGQPSSPPEYPWRIPLPRPRIQLPKDDSSIEGHIERFPRPIENTLSFNRQKRSVESDEDDLQAEEAKIFRPLFVYRQQVAERHRAQRSRNPIYGAYQYSPRRPVNHSNDANFRKHKSQTDRHVNALN